MNFADKYPHEVAIDIIMEPAPIWLCVFGVVATMFFIMVHIIFASFAGEVMSIYNVKEVAYQFYIVSGLQISSYLTLALLGWLVVSLSTLTWGEI